MLIQDGIPTKEDIVTVTPSPERFAQMREGLAALLRSASAQSDD